jgi:hypothetical protein
MKFLSRSFVFGGDAIVLMAVHGAWFSVFLLACRQASWLLDLGNNPVPPIAVAAGLTIGKFAIGRGALARENELRTALRMFILFGAKGRFLDKDDPIPVESDNLALWVALRAGSLDDWKSYVSGFPLSRLENDNIYKDITFSIGAYARNHELQRRLELLDAAIVAAAKGVEGRPKPNCLLGLRQSLLNEAASRYLEGATHPNALLNFIGHTAEELPADSAIKVFLRKIAYELGSQRDTRLYHLTWEMLESWLTVVPPANISDLFGLEGMRVPMDIPDVLREALEHDREAESLKGAKTYY